MNHSLLSLGRQSSRYAGLIGIATALVTCSGCGGSSDSNNVLNGNAGTPGGGTSTGLVGGSTGGVGSGPPFTQTGTPLANVSLPTGVWGGAENVDGAVHPGSLQVSRSGGQLSLYCGRSAQYTGAIALDAAGSFRVEGTGHLRIAPEPADSGRVVFSGKAAVSTVNGKSVTSLVLDVSDPVSNVGFGSYVLILGDTASTYAGTCPGP